jgi:hypothetical protein
MVLLPPSGEANLSTYELIETVADRFDTNGAVPLGVEASVGWFQALDVGTSKAPSGGNQGSTFIPAAAANPSAAPESASVKNTAQPS